MQRTTTVLILCALAAPLAAQQAVATGGVNVRTGQSTASQILDHLEAGDTVKLLSANPRKGYYHVEEPNGTQGWVYIRYLDVIGTAAATTPPAPDATAPTIEPSGSVLGSVSSSWNKPAP